MTYERDINNILRIEDAKIWALNFSGVAGRYNNPGDRNFCVDLDPELGNVLKEEGWNIKWHKPRDDEENPAAFVQIKVKYDAPNPRLAPKIYVLKNGNRKELMTEETVGALDNFDIVNVDLEIRPREWKLDSGKTGVKAYLSEMYVTIAESKFAQKYAAYDDGADNDEECPF